MTALRTPGSGCPWDLAQTHASLVPYALEEAYEVVDAIERGTVDDLRDELGDLLFQVVFHSQIAAEAGRFDFGDVVLAVTTKMLRRHPHVFDRAVSNADVWPSLEATNRAWEAIKAEEIALGGRPRGLLDDVPGALPGLTRAVKLQKRAASVGFDWNDIRLVLDKIREEIDEIQQEIDRGCADALAGEIGDLLFAVANLARHAGVDPETAARATNGKFARRFAYIEAELARQGRSCDAATLAEMDGLWDAAKRAGL